MNYIGLNQCFDLNANPNLNMDKVFQKYFKIKFFSFNFFIIIIITSKLLIFYILNFLKR